jgi:outer membrane protein assembly factor BamD
MYKRLLIAAAFLLPAFLPGCASEPAFQGLGVDELFELGTREFQEEDWDEAVRVFEHLVFADPTYERMVEVRMYLARSYFNKQEYLTAISEFTRIMDRHPGHSLAPEAALGVCRSYAELSPHVQRDQTYTRQAYSACSNVVADFTGYEPAVEAARVRDRMEEKLARKVFIGGKFYFDRDMYDSAIIYFNDVVGQYARTETAARALLHLYRSYTEIGWEREAEEARTRLLEEYPDSAEAQEVRAEDNGGGDSGEGGGGGQGERGGEEDGPGARHRIG